LSTVGERDAERKECVKRKQIVGRREEKTEGM
jgi:hypothetical protein